MLCIMLPDILMAKLAVSMTAPRSVIGIASVQRNGAACAVPRSGEEYGKQAYRFLRKNDVKQCVLIFKVAIITHWLKSRLSARRIMPGRV